MGLEGTVTFSPWGVVGKQPFIKAQRDIDLWQEEMETWQKLCILKETFYIIDELCFPKASTKTLVELHFIVLISVYYVLFAKVWLLWK